MPESLSIGTIWIQSRVEVILALIFPSVYLVSSLTMMTNRAEWNRSQLFQHSEHATCSLHLHNRRIKICHDEQTYRSFLSICWQRYPTWTRFSLNWIRIYFPITSNVYYISFVYIEHVTQILVVILSYACIKFHSAFIESLRPSLVSLQYTR